MFPIPLKKLKKKNRNSQKYFVLNLSLKSLSLSKISGNWKMEGLEKLGQVQSTINLLHSVGVSDANPVAERFLADFTSLLMQRCGELEVTSKCELISKHISKILDLFTGGALQCGSKGCSSIGNDLQLYCDNKTNLDRVQSLHDNVAMVGMDAMIRSNSTLEDFCRSYFMFHKMEANQPNSIFRYLPMLSFTESYIYQLDDLNEKLLQLPRDGVSIFPTEFKDPFRPLVSVLEQHGILTERIIEELRCGEEYWALERKLCCALVSNDKISIEDVIRAIHLKSFDYRMLNLLLYQLRGEKVNELHMEFLSISELLVEISDDLFDYEDDVLENNFNVLRMFVKYYGASSAPVMMANFITEAEEKYDKLLKSLEDELSVMYKKRCEEATKEGGKIYGPPLGTWHMPTVIADEIGYRTKFSSKTP
ncbi:hypothetical protein ABFX02_08G219600 [Erythranthe guttata]